MNGITASALALLGVALRAFYSGDDHHIDRSVVKVCYHTFQSNIQSMFQSMFQCEVFAN